MDLTELLLTVQGALIGEVPPNLRALAVRREDEKITLECIFDGPISDDDYDAMASVATEIEADYFPPYWCDVQVVRIDAPERFFESVAGRVVYGRREY